MTRKALTILLASVAAVAVIAVLIATSMGDHSTSQHTMPNGQMMDGSTMPANHTMSNGTTMPGSQMDMP